MIPDHVRIEIPADILKNWQEIVDLLAEIIQIPAALIMRFTDPDIEVFVSNRGKDNPYHPGDKEILFGSGLYCETVIKTQGRLLIPNALADESWKNNPDVRLNMISYLGFPIFFPDKTPFGIICVLDNHTNEYSKTVEKLMQKFRGLIESHLEMIYINHMLGDKNKRLIDYSKEIQALRGLVTICANCKNIRDEQNNWHPVEHYLSRKTQVDFSHGICPECMKKFYPECNKSSRYE